MSQTTVNLTTWTSIGTLTKDELFQSDVDVMLSTEDPDDTAFEDGSYTIGLNRPRIMQSGVSVWAKIKDGAVETGATAILRHQPESA